MRIAISCWVVALCTATVTATALASPLSDALARHDAAAVAKLRELRADAAARCTLGAVYAKRGDLARAGYFLAGCDAAALPDDVAAEIGKLAQDTMRRLRDSDLSSIEINSRPEGMAATTTALPGETLTLPAKLWVRPGTYEIRSTHDGQTYVNVVETRAHAGTTVWVEAAPASKPRVPKAGRVDFGEDNAVEAPTQGSPPPVKRGSLMSKKLRGEIEPAGTLPVLDDPLATRTTGPVRSARSYWLGLRLGGGMFDDGAATARPGIALAAVGRLALTRSAFVAGRVDWSRRGGDAMDAVDVLGVAAGAGITVVDRGSIALALIAQLRGDLRLASTRADAAVARTGASAAAGVELALPGTPITAGLRFEQGLTELVPGARDRAVLVELGVDWR